MSWCFVGLDISVVHAINDLVKKKAARLHMWKGQKKTRKYITNRYLKVATCYSISQIALTTMRPHNEQLKNSSLIVQYFTMSSCNKPSDSCLFQQKYSLTKLSTWEQLILTLVRLRRKLTITVLADVFGSASGTASRLVITCISSEVFNCL